ncbi:MULTISPECIES: tetratricopeptide repeat protein [Thalassolituus]|mgnify:FL=1|jgi:type IV pilus assembly protein PilF|uniref:tetratricopeptide repeat protein n=1 Tax=Thalassolituus TaxID=187492 RepID=UPI001B7462C3|nr:tetratricopeptide repeat protein [Thalassolituus oleivorans]MBQ0726234.1 hypothetical protein [Thalassolituus oleivorans]MDF1639835.1 hypothetical protein [Thalassolituus oleivorans]
MTGRVLARCLLICLPIFFLAGCVTVTESRFTKKESPEKSVENYTQLGIGYLQKGRPDWARQRLQKALAINPNYAPANDAMGMVWQTEGELDLAEEYFLKAINEDKTFTLARHHIGRLYSQLKQSEKAQENLQKAADDRYYDNRPGAYNDLALNFYRMDKSQLAIDAYLQTLRLAPYNVDALVNVSTLLFEAQNYEESLKYFDRFDRLVQRNQTRHTAHSLWLGIKLVTIQQNTARAIEFATELKQNFTNSTEYRLYQESLAGHGA